MKKIILPFLAFALLTGFQSLQAQCAVTVSWKFLNIVEGYDHDNKCIAYIDGEKVKESSVTPESKPNSMKFSVPKGEHDIRIVSLAYYEGKWEEHTVDNEYSQDCLYEGTHDFKKKKSFDLVFDIDNGTSFKIKPAN